MSRSAAISGSARFRGIRHGWSAASTPSAAPTTSRDAASTSCATAGPLRRRRRAESDAGLTTERLIQGVTANVNLRGTLDKPEMVLSSTPPLEQADMLSLIVFNQPINQLGEGQQVSLAQRAQQLATGVVASQARAIDRKRAGPRHVRDQHRA